VTVAATLALLGVAPPAALAAGAIQNPTAAQIRTAVRRAEHSRYLWSTINICDTSRHPDVVGIRGQMPSLGFSALLSMDIQLDYWSTSEKRFIQVPGNAAHKQLSLGSPANGVHQGGIDFSVTPHAGLLSGEITFTWRRGGRLLAELTRPASAGHPDADFGDPEHYSAGECEIR
jgi:hypothetical protein